MMTEKKGHIRHLNIFILQDGSVIDGLSVYEARHACGRYLYEQNPIKADLVIRSVPEYLQE